MEALLNQKSKELVSIDINKIQPGKELHFEYKGIQYVALRKDDYIE